MIAQGFGAKIGDIALDDIRETAALIAPYVERTPIHIWKGNDAPGGPETEVVLKLELLQHTGTFKVRGALSQMLHLPDPQRRRGVTAVSAGNHAIAVAYVASVLGVPAKVVMLQSANSARLAAARSYGAEILMAPDGRSAFALADRLVADEGLSFVHPFDGRNVSLGTATLGLEFAEQAGPLDAVIVAIGGGGLASGVAAAVKLAQPGCRVYGVEPSGAAIMRQSFDAGEPQQLATVATIADSLAPPMTLPYSFNLCRTCLDDLVLVDDAAMTRMMARLFGRMKFAVEPACTAALAALAGPLRETLKGQRVGVVLCGSNIDPATFARYVGGDNDA